MNSLSYSLLSFILKPIRDDIRTTDSEFPQTFDFIP